MRILKAHASLGLGFPDPEFGLLLLVEPLPNLIFIYFILFYLFNFNFIIYFILFF